MSKNKPTASKPMAWPLSDSWLNSVQEDLLRVLNEAAEKDRSRDHAQDRGGR